MALFLPVSNTTAGSSSSPFLETSLPFFVVIVVLHSMLVTHLINNYEYSLFSLDIQDLALGLSLSPVPAHSLTLLWSFLCARVITALIIILLLFSIFLLL